MQIFGVPYTHYDMSYQLSLTGLTVLKQGRFKSRHGGAKDLVQVPGQGFKLKSQVKREERLANPPKKKRKKKQPEPVNTPTNPKITKAYKIDKVQVRHRINNYLLSMKGEKLLYFWTVTFPKGTTDDTAYILLNKWFTRLRKEKMLKEYLWVAERQENGTIHFHICINNRMSVVKANKYMRASIMHSINNNEIIYSRDAAMKYNGVDIAKDRKTKRVINFAKGNKQKSLSNYLTKYVTKNDGTFTHLAWHSSRGYSNIIISVRMTREELIGKNISARVVLESKIESEYFIFYRWKGQPPKELTDYLAKINQHIQSLFN